MKKVILLFILTSLSCIAQDKKDKHGDIVLFSKGIALYELANDEFELGFDVDSIDTLQGKKLISQQIRLKEDVLDKSLYYFEQLIEEYPKSKLYFQALNNRARIEFELEDFKAAKETYIKIFESKVNNDDDPNHMNEVVKRLSTIEYNLKNYKKSIEYLDLTTKYPFVHFCGNAYADNDIYMATNYALSYIGLNDRKTALNYLLPYFLENDLTSNKELAELAAKTLKDEYGKDEAKMIFENAKKSLAIKDVGDKDEEYKVYYINFNGKNIELVTPFEVYAENADKEIANMREFLNKSYFNKLLNE